MDPITMGYNDEDDVERPPPLPPPLRKPPPPPPPKPRRQPIGPFNDDEPIVLPPGSRPTVPGRVQLVIRNNGNAPPDENIQKVMLELTGEEKSRLGLDLVVVITPYIYSKEVNKLAQLKTAMSFLLKKLSVVDRLSMVMSGNSTKRLCPLRQMTESTRMEFENQIISLTAEGCTNIANGLETALKILEDRSISRGRVSAIMLTSDGKQNLGRDAAAVPIGNVRVHTFGIGIGHDAKLLKAIADNSRLGGTYSDVRLDNLLFAFSQCLGGLLSVVAQDLTVTLNQTKDVSTIKQVSAGNYPQSVDNSAGSVTVTFGDIYIQEVRKVLVDIHLPATGKKQSEDVLEVSFTYKFDGELFEASPEIVTVHHMLGLTAEEQQALPEVRAEEIRLLIAEVTKQAIADADKENLEGAQDKLTNGLKTLKYADIEKLKGELRAELQELLDLMSTRALYEKRGRPFAYSLLISLTTQRQTARGYNIDKCQLFATPTMQEFLQEAKKLHDIDDHKQYSIDPFTKSFNDDHPVVLDSDSGSVPKHIVLGKLQLVIKNNNMAPLKKNIQKVLLELSSEENSQFGLDIVAVLDASSSMEGDKLEEMKRAMLRLIRNLSFNDHLSIIEYSTKAKTLCQLSQLTESSQAKLENMIHDLNTQTGTNITDGLVTALNVLNNRSDSIGRVGVIMLMSDGEQNLGGDAADIPVGNIPVLTFGFGEDQNPEVLIAIANNSRLGGTYTEVCLDNLILTFSHCLDELQSVVLWDLKVTITQIKNGPTVKQASAGRYLHSIENTAGSVTITFGTLYRQDICRVLVHILLPVTKKEGEVDVFKISCTYRNSFDGELFVANPATVTVGRTATDTSHGEYTFYETGIAQDIVIADVKLLIAEVIKQATGVADKEDLKIVLYEIGHSLTTLENTDYLNWVISKLNEHLDDLRAELEELIELMQAQAINEKQGRSFAYFLLISRFAQRGLARGKFELFASPVMREFLEKAKMYDEIDDLHVYIDRFICAMESIQMIIKEKIVWS